MMISLVPKSIPFKEFKMEAMFAVVKVNRAFTVPVDMKVMLFSNDMILMSFKITN